MDAQNERLGWLNKYAPQILTSPTVSPHSRDQNVGKLRAVNLKWSKVPTHPSSLAPLTLRCLPLHRNTCALPCKVTHELLEKTREVEANLQSHTQFEDKMNRLTDWVIVTHQTIITRGLSSSQAQVFLKTGLFFFFFLWRRQTLSSTKMVN